jgi:hypothetical protein
LRYTLLVASGQNESAEMQGDFREMQGGAKRKLAKRQRISIAWEALSLLQGSREGSGEANPEAGFITQDD